MHVLDIIKIFSPFFFLYKAHSFEVNSKFYSKITEDNPQQVEKHCSVANCFNKTKVNYHFKERDLTCIVSTRVCDPETEYQRRRK